MKKLRSQKNIIFYNPSFETGGVEKNIKSYIDHAQNLKNYKKILLTLDNTNINKNLYFQYPAKKFKFKSRLIKYFICFYYLFKISLKKDSIILSFQNNIFAILIAVITNTKIIVRLNTAPEKYINSYLQKKIFSFFYKLANLIIVNDEDFKKSVKKYFNINSKIIHNFVNYDEVKKQSRENVKKNFFKKKTSIKIITSTGSPLAEESFKYVYDNIKKISVDDVIIDSHPWTIVERQMGARDQFSDILSVLFIYSNIDSFFKMSFGQIYHPLTFFKNNNNWSIIDPYYGVYFLNDRNQFCNLNEHKSKKCFFFHLEFGKISNDVLSKIFFDKNFKNLIELNNYYNLLFEAFPNALEIKNTNIYLRGGRSYVQKPTHRLIYELQKIFN